MQFQKGNAPNAPKNTILEAESTIELTIKTKDTKKVAVNEKENKSFPSNKDACAMTEKEEIDGIEDLFQLEIVEGEDLYACNVCNEGFENNNDIKKHIQNDHSQVLLQIRKEMYEASDEDDGSNDKHKHKHTVSDYDETDGEDDEAFLAKFDDDGNLR